MRSSLYFVDIFCSYRRAKAFNWQERGNVVSRKLFLAGVGPIRLQYEHRWEDSRVWVDPVITPSSFPVSLCIY